MRLSLLTIAQTQSENIIKTANEAQLKAEQRDYIADSIAQSLEKMGFNLVYRQAEHPDRTNHVADELPTSNQSRRI
jgi:hypothetical protein